MVRVLLLLIVLGVLALFVVQNANPVISLTILGMQTIALPLSVWILGAIAAGAVTALLTGALVRLAGGRRTSRRRASGKGSSRRGSAPDWTPPPWTGRSAEPQDAPRPNRPSRNPDDDWGTTSSNDDWDEWARGEDMTRTQSIPRSTVRPPVTPPIRDAEFRPLDVETVYPEPADEPIYGETYSSSYGNSYGDFGDRTPYDTSSYDTSYDATYEEPGYQEREVWDDWSEEEAVRSQPPSPPPEETPPARDIVEIRRDPQSTERTGTIYSFSYRTEEETPIVTPEPEPPASNPTEVTPLQEESVSPVGTTEPIVTSPPEDEPRIRVIIPPYRSTPPAPEPPPAIASEEDDWEEDDVSEDPVVDGRGADENWDGNASGDREVWDDWDDDESDEPDDEPGGGPSPRSPRDNPPLQF